MVALLFLLVSSFLSEFCLYLPCLYDYPGKFPARSTAFTLRLGRGVCSPFLCSVEYGICSGFVRDAFGF